MSIKPENYGVSESRDWNVQCSHHSNNEVCIQSQFLLKNWNTKYISIHQLHSTGTKPVSNEIWHSIQALTVWRKVVIVIYMKAVQHSTGNNFQRWSYPRTQSHLRKCASGMSVSFTSYNISHHYPKLWKLVNMDICMKFQYIFFHTCTEN